MHGFSEHDAALYQRYKQLFIDNGVAEFYRRHDFLGAFEEEVWSPLSEYVDNWHRVEFEFVDAKLEKVHKNVYSSAAKLAGRIATYTVGIGKSGNLRSVKPDSLLSGPTPQAIIDQAKEINELAPPFVAAHEKFVRLANKRLSGETKGWTFGRIIAGLVVTVLGGAILYHYTSWFDGLRDSDESETKPQDVSETVEKLNHHNPLIRMVPKNDPLRMEIYLDTEKIRDYRKDYRVMVRCSAITPGIAFADNPLNQVSRTYPTTSVV
jgi:hypothetical protein